PEREGETAARAEPAEESAREQVAHGDEEAEEAEGAVASGEPMELGDEVFTADEVALIRSAEEAGAGGSKRAVDAWRDVVARMPDKIYPRRRLRDLYEQTNKWSNVADLVKDELRAVPAQDVGAQE